MKLVIIETPYAGNIKKNIEYAKMCMRDCLLRNEAPYASHLLYTLHGILDDDIKEERELGIKAGLEWGRLAEKTIVYTDLGISKGMQQGISAAKKYSREIEYRTLPQYTKK